MARTVYLNNRDLLKEVHLSKISYCSFLNKPLDHQHDAIVYSVNDINDDVIAEARAARNDRLKREGLELDTFTTQDLVFRVYTWEHIPFAPPKASKVVKKNLDELFDMEDPLADVPELVAPPEAAGHIKLNFNPFFHYRLDADNKPILVGKSHWKGDLQTGKFSKDHGNITATLAKMFIRLCDRYASRANWRGYTYNEEMRGEALVQLSMVGLKFDEAKSNNPFSYFTQIVCNAFLRVLSTEKKMQNIRDDILEMNGLTPSWTRQNSGSAPAQPITPTTNE